jgi:ribonuclease VapC
LRGPAGTTLMVIDSSALVAILFKEPERDTLLRAIQDAETRLVSTVTALEAGMVLEARRGPRAGAALDLLLHDTKVEMAPFDQVQSDVARRCVYALAKISGEPILCKGSDFGQTDFPTVTPASEPQ